MTCRSLLAALLCVACAGVARADEETRPPAGTRAPADERPTSKSGYGTDVAMGPGSTEAALAGADAIRRPIFSLGAVDRALQPYFAWKARLNTRHKFKFGLDYQALYQRVDSSPGEDEAASDILRVFGEWGLVNRCGPCGQGSLVWKVEHRGKLGTAIAPQALGSEFGYGGITGALFSDLGLIVTNLFWKQRFGVRNQGVLIAGQVDATDYIDIVGIGNPFTAWQNLSVLVNPTIPLPNQGLGVAASWVFDRHWYGIAGFSDANAIPTRDFTQTWRGFETFKHVEFGWTKSRAQFFSQNAHVTAWHQDEREQAGVPEAWGWAASALTPFGCGFSAAVRAGWSSAAVGFAKRHAGCLFQYSFNLDADAVGLGVGWDDVWGAEQDDQLSAELFLRAQLAQNLALTPSIQYIKNPAFNPGDDEAWVFGLRLRLTF